MQKNEKIFYRSVVVISIIGAALTTALGVLLHFLYEYTDKSFVASLISPVNESVWEHLKLIFIPFFMLALIEYAVYGRSFGRFFYSKLTSVTCAMLLTVIAHYTYSGIIGKSVIAIDMIIYISAVFFGYGLALYQLLSAGIKDHPEKKELLSVFGFVTVLAIFFVATFIQPKIDLFLDPEAMYYGIPQ